jgi:hypothetical protein
MEQFERNSTVQRFVIMYIHNYYVTLYISLLKRFYTQKLMMTATSIKF